MRTSKQSRFGVTLIELIVALAIVGLILGVVGPSLSARRVPTTPPWIATIMRARRTAIDSGRAVAITVRINDTLHAATAFPDGSMTADSSLPVDRLTGIFKTGAEGHASRVPSK